MARHQEIVRDLAKLLVKYDLEDWQFVIGLLRTGATELAPLTSAIDEIVRNRPSPRRATASKIKVLVPANIEPHRAELLQTLAAQFIAKGASWKLHDIRDLYVMTGGKEPLPKKRDEGGVFWNLIS